MRKWIKLWTSGRKGREVRKVKGREVKWREGKGSVVHGRKRRGVKWREGKRSVFEGRGGELWREGKGYVGEGREGVLWREEEGSKIEGGEGELSGWRGREVVLSASPRQPHGLNLCISRHSSVTCKRAR